jgi:hypothetical protein
MRCFATESRTIQIHLDLLGNKVGDEMRDATFPLVMSIASVNQGWISIGYHVAYHMTRTKSSGAEFPGRDFSCPEWHLPGHNSALWMPHSRCFNSELRGLIVKCEKVLAPSHPHVLIPARQCQAISPIRATSGVRLSATRANEVIGVRESHEGRLCCLDVEYHTSPYERMRGRNTLYDSKC